jgi:hypothetical protein|nr:MAG TPA: hypothetical protein [Caudoviricetes sp.]
MKEFNLKAALNGEPVMLRNGCKAIVYYIIPEEYTFPDGRNSTYPLRGLIFDKDGFIENSFYFWLEDGRCHRECYKPNDIIGMWEEPKISIEDLPKPFTPEETQHYYYINGGYIECEDEFAAKNDFDGRAAKRGNCFRTREDAQKWLDFMKSIME